MTIVTKWFLDNPVAANLLMVFILVAGFLSFNSLRVESFPQVPPSRLIIDVSYPGGTAKQVDEGITQRIEDAISGIAGIKSITSESYAGFASIRVKKSTGVDLSLLLEKVRNEVDSIVGFPERAERPKIYKDEFGNLASFVMIYGDVTNDTLQRVSTVLENALKKHEAISKVSNLGKRRQELVIEPNPNKIKAYGLSYQSIAEHIHQWSLLHRSGELKTSRGTITLKADNYSDTLPALAAIPLITTSDGILTLGEVADISRTYEKTDGFVRFQGKPGIALMISTSQKDNLLDVSEATQSVIDEVKAQFPEKVNAVVMADMAPYIGEQLDMLGTNAWQGLLIVIILLGIFLEFRLAMWVAMGIPISLAGALFLMGLPSIDFSINDITLFGMILVLGILVDDAVVVGESIHYSRGRTKNLKQASLKGVEAVSVATIFGALTTIAAFSPMLWIENELAQVLSGFSVVVIFALIFSLIESKFILPTHLASSNAHAKPTKLSQLIRYVRTQCNNGLDWFSQVCYQPVLSTALKHKGAAITVFLIAIIGAYGAMMKGTIKTVFFPEIPGRYATLIVEMDQDASFSLTKSHVKHVEQAINATNEALSSRYTQGRDVISKYLLFVEGAEKVEATVELSKEGLGKVPSQKFLDEWKRQTGNLEGSYAQKFTFSESPAGGTFVTINAPSRDLAMHIAKQVKRQLKQLPGVNDVVDDGQIGKRQLQVTINQRGINLGLTQRNLADLVGGAFGHVEIHRMLDQGEESLVLLRLPEKNKMSIQQLQETPVHLGDNNYVTLSEIATFNFNRQPEVLYRKNRQQVISVYWRQDRNVASPTETWQVLSSGIVEKIHKQYPSVEVAPAGEFEELGEVQAGFKKAMLLTLLLIYVLLAIPLKSYWQPLIIMSVIPFGFAGAIYGHGIMGLSVSLLSLFGMMAMTGVVINDSLVLITRFNQLYAKGMTMRDALITAGKSRLRAIFLTTTTTVCGLIPLLMESSEQAQYLKPAAVSLVFGELFATPITLILIPIILSFGKYRTSTQSPSLTKSDVAL